MERRPWHAAASGAFAAGCAAFVAASLSLRLVEFAAYNVGESLTPGVCLSAAIADLLFALRWSLAAAIVGVVVSLILHNRAAHAALMGLFFLPSLVAASALTEYFHTSGVPLGSDLFGYTLEEIRTTVAAGAAFELRTALLFLLPIAVYAFVYAALVDRIAGGRPAAAIIMLSLASFAVTSDGIVNRHAEETERTIAISKPRHFLADTIEYLRGNDIPAAKEPLAVGTVDGGFEYLDANYPFLRRNDAEDVLGEYFTPSAGTKPNFVFILVEGLGRAFSGPDAYLGSYTPFLDSLANDGLSWRNFLAPQGRTFGLLPSLFGSLPFGEKGFLNLGARMPRHSTLISILREHGYAALFVGGFNLDFDNERIFFERQGVDLMIEKRHLVGSADGFRSYWGLPDRIVMERAVREPQRSPFVMIIQTMSMHTPYEIPEQAEFLARFERRTAELGLPAGRAAKNKEYAHIFSTVLYFDDALERFFAAFKKRPEWNNTIFVITGDHRLPEIPLSTRIDRYHVPFVIYSPLLKKPAAFASISSHFDVAPSLLAFMRTRHGVRLPDEVVWIGDGLDTSAEFRNVHRIPMKQTKTNLRHFASGSFFLDDRELFRISPSMDLEPAVDADAMARIAAEFDDFTRRNAAFARSLKLAREP